MYYGITPLPKALELKKNYKENMKYCKLNDNKNTTHLKLGKISYNNAWEK